MFDAVTCAIPGARRPQQVEDNARAAELPALTDAEMKAVRKIYDVRIRPTVHHRW
jgi:aryl-alcohol dehydrogenase-like predicted oxidoreductase